MKRVINIVFIFIFAVLISFPYLFAHRDRQGRVSSMENRMLARYPVLWDAEEGLNTDYLSQFELWLNDNLRGRTVMTEINSTLQYKLFGRIVKTDILRGKNNWLFVRDDEMIREFQHQNLMSEAELDAYALNMQKIADYMKNKEIAFYYFQCYSKETIYPEQYASGINQIGTVYMADQIVSALETKTSVEQVLVKEILAEHKDELVYYQYVDSLHWNERGSYFGYQVFMDTIRKDFPMVPVLGEEDYLITEAESAVDLYGYLYPYAELCPIYTIKEPKATEITQTETDIERWDFLRFKEHTHEYINEDSGNDLKILILGDSFFRMFLKDDVAESFASTLSIDWLNISILEEVIEEYQPDIVVIESAESALPDTIGLINQVDLSE